jgi:hypothetical protein
MQKTMCQQEHLSVRCSVYRAVFKFEQHEAVAGCAAA